MNLFSLALTNMDAIIGIVVVVFWIVIQIANRKEGKNAPPQTPAGPGDPTNPQDEIRKFFEQLEKGLAGEQQEETVAPPPPPPPRPARTPAASPRRFPSRAAAPVSPVPVERPAADAYADAYADSQPSPEALELQRKQVLATLEREAALRSVRHTTAGTSPELRYAALRDQIRQPSSLRQLILASEILAKPVGLRVPAPSP